MLQPDRKGFVSDRGYLNTSCELLSPGTAATDHEADPGGSVAVAESIHTKIKRALADPMTPGKYPQHHMLAKQGSVNGQPVEHLQAWLRGGIKSALAGSIAPARDA